MTQNVFVEVCWVCVATFWCGRLQTAVVSGRSCWKLLPSLMEPMLLLDNAEPIGNSSSITVFKKGIKNNPAQLQTEKEVIICEKNNWTQRAVTWRSALKPGESSVLWVFEALMFLKSRVKISVQRACLLKVHTSIFGCLLISHITRVCSRPRQRKY